MTRSLSEAGRSVVPSITGTLGPYTSASSRPTDAPIRWSAMAKFTATVVLPTPPLPLATAIKFLTPEIAVLSFILSEPLDDWGLPKDWDKHRDQIHPRSDGFLYADTENPFDQYPQRSPVTERLLAVDPDLFCLEPF